MTQTENAVVEELVSALHLSRQYLQVQIIEAQQGNISRDLGDAARRELARIDAVIAKSIPATAAPTPGLNYRIERYIGSQTEVIHLGQIPTSTARARARRLSKKPGDWGFIDGQSVYLIGADDDGADQEMYSYFGGEMTEKDLVKDWDK